MLDLEVLEHAGIFNNASLTRSLQGAFSQVGHLDLYSKRGRETETNQTTLNAFAAFPAADRSLVRLTIIQELSRPDSPLFKDDELNGRAFVPRLKVRMHMPMSITDYSDSFGSLIHAQNVSVFLQSVEHKIDH